MVGDEGGVVDVHAFETTLLAIRTRRVPARL